jgi:hypothetical protein
MYSPIYKSFKTTKIPTSRATSSVASRATSASSTKAPESFSSSIESEAIIEDQGKLSLVEIARRFLDSPVAKKNLVESRIE